VPALVRDGRTAARFYARFTITDADFHLALAERRPS
jgi:hypothetical protein